MQLDLPADSASKEPACQCRRPETCVQSLGQEEPLEEGTVTHSNILAWRIPGRGAWGGGVPTIRRVTSQI